MQSTHAHNRPSRARSESRKESKQNTGIKKTKSLEKWRGTDAATVVQSDGDEVTEERTWNAGQEKRTEHDGGEPDAGQEQTPRENEQKIKLWNYLP